MDSYRNGFVVGLCIGVSSMCLTFNVVILILILIGVI